MGDMRITGLATGLDVDSLVKQMMRVENIRLDKAKQDMQILEWRQELYRDIIGDLNVFKSTYFDLLKPDTNMLSAGNYSSFDVSQLDTLTAAASSGAVAGDYKITVNQLAEKAAITGTTEINIAEAFKDFSFPAQITTENKDFTINADGNSYSITLDEGNFYPSDLAAKINSKLSFSTGADGSTASSKVRAAVSSDGKSIRFVGVEKINDDNKTLNIDIGGSAYNVTLSTGDFTMDQIASQINNSLSARGIDGKIRAEVSEDGSSIHFVNVTLEDTGLPDESISVNGSALDNTTTQGADGTYKVDNMSIGNANATALNTLEYDRKIIADVNDTLSIRINGRGYTVKLAPTPDGSIGYGKPSIGTSDAAIREDLVTKLRDGLKNAVNSTGQVVNLVDPGVDDDSDTLDVRLSLDGTRIQFVSNTNKTINVTGNAAPTLGFSSSFDVNMGLSSKMSTLMEGQVGDGVVSFTINDGTKNVEFRYDFNTDEDVNTGTEENPIIVVGAKDKSISDIINDISSRANAKLSYSQLTRKFTLESGSTGSAQSISFAVGASGDADDTSFLTTVFGVTSGSGEGKNAVITIANPNAKPTDPNGGRIEVIKSTNSFAIDGISYNLVKADGVEKTLTVTSDPKAAFDKIKAFVEKYNEIIDKINTKLVEKKQYDYNPLTDEQKEGMKEDDIKKWEEKAKQGLLRNDNILENMLSAMRNAFYDPVKANYNDSGSIGISLTEIGLSTSSDTLQRGKIVIDEEKLKEAIETKGDMITNLFTKVSSSVPRYSPSLSSDERSQRYKEEGIFQRISDILQDNLRITRNSYGKKGTLLEKAGIKGDFTEYNNILSDQLKSKDRAIDELNDKLIEKENKYYQQFAQLEKAMQRMNEQSNWLAQQLGSWGGN